MAAPKIIKTPPAPLPPSLRNKTEHKTVLRGRNLVPDEWRYFDEDPTGASGHVILPFALWQAQREKWLAWDGKLGVRLLPAERVELLESDLKRFSLVAVEFSGPSEGRGYTKARVLRDRFAFAGEIRAVGYIKRDQMFFLARCGFDAFEPTADSKLEEIVAALSDFDTAYQPTPDNLLNLKRRHA